MYFPVCLFLTCLTMSNQPGGLAEEQQRAAYVNLHHSHSVEFGACPVPSHPARQAITSGDLDKLRSLVANEPSVIDYQGVNYGETLLHVAVTNNQEDIVTYLVQELEFDVNVRDANGATPAHYAVTSSRMNNNAALKMVTLLKELGADLNLVDNEDSSLVQDAQGEERSDAFVGELRELISKSNLNIPYQASR